MAEISCGARGRSGLSMLRQGAGCAGYATDQHLAAILCRSGAGRRFFSAGWARDGRAGCYFCCILSGLNKLHGLFYIYFFNRGIYCRNLQDKTTVVKVVLA
jgi:hypothetical protein